MLAGDAQMTVSAISSSTLKRRDADGNETDEITGYILTQQIEVLEHHTVYDNPIPALVSRHAFFPGMEKRWGLDETSLGFYDLEETLTSLGTGEAVVTALEGAGWAVKRPDGGGVLAEIGHSGRLVALRAGQVVSVNLPPLMADQQPTGVRVVRQCIRPWADTYEERKDPRGRPYFWNSSVFTLGETEDDTDVSALRDNYITVTPLQFGS